MRGRGAARAAGIAATLLLTAAVGCGDPVEPEPRRPLLVAVGSSNTVMSYDGSDWSFMRGPDAYWFTAAWATGPENFYIATTLGNGGLLHYDGTDWSWPVPEDLWADSYSPLWDVWGAAADAIYAVGDNSVLLHYDGERWAPLQPDGTGAHDRSRHLLAVWGVGPDRVFAVGTAAVDSTWSSPPREWRPAIWHYDGSSWSRMVLPDSLTDPGPHDLQLRDIWGTGPDDVWAVGDGGLVLHYDGQTWSRIPSGTDARLYGVHAPARSRIYIVGQGGTLLRWSGGRFRASDTGTEAHLSAVREVSEDEIVAVGWSGTIIRWDGSAWSPVETDATAHLYGLWAF